MLRGELPSRFDYLFEPLEADEPDGNGGDAPPEILLRPEEDNRWSNRMVLAGVVLATLAAAAAMAIVLLQRARPADQIVTPSDATSPATATSPPMSTSMPTTTTAPVPVLPATLSTAPARTPEQTPTVQRQQPAVQPAPTTIASEPPAPMPPPPTTRAPISVSPETRAPFPNHTPPRNNDQRSGGGGLLGGLL
ncbi:MAG TPA: hypothetical protein VHJ79_12915 [Mycobacterium sp.]|jgi:hypothetical protein|nr:hypothetical protein [Mycobacterium sp.]